MHTIFNYSRGVLTPIVSLFLAFIVGDRNEAYQVWKVWTPCDTAWVGLDAGSGCGAILGSCLWIHG